MQSIELSANYHTIKTRIANAETAFHRTPDSVRLLAVSKRQSGDKIRRIAQLGQTDFGESYVQEALEKMTDLRDLALTWHFIGPIQSNKTKLIAERFHWVHSVDRDKIAERLSRQRPESLPALNVCIQANISREPTKAGFFPDEVLHAAQKIARLPNLVLRGLMVIPAPCTQFDHQRHVFRTAQQLYASMRQDSPQLDTLSMGMSGDMQAAIAEQSTCVRIGSALFGQRK